VDSVFCDFVQVTTPVGDWASLRSGLEPYLDMLGASVEFDSGAAGGESSEVLWRAGDYGTVRAKRYSAVMAVGTSGGTLGAFRAAGLLGKWLAALGSGQHTVTRLDATMDRAADAAPEIARIVAAGSGDPGISLSRKRVAPRDITQLTHRRPDGLDTGTVYVGARQADVRACVYDKREERLSRGLDDIGPMVRYEVRLGKAVGASLRDAHDPEAIFWHFAAPGLLSAPEGVPAWFKHGEGFRCDQVDVPTPLARLRRRVQASADVAALVRLAREVGPYGEAMLVQELRALFEVSPLAHVVDAGAVDLGARPS
jgi:hypothetical protein